MNRSEYLVELTLCLKGLPDDERQSAVNYYAEYFDEAGKGNEQAVISELGAPSEVAARILEDADLRERRERRERRAMRPGIILLWIFASPILIPLFAAGFVVFISLMCVLFVLIVCAAILLFVPWLVFVVFAACAIFLAFCTVQLVFMHVPTACFFGGAAAAMLGLALIIYGAFRRPFATALRFIGSMFGKAAQLMAKPFYRRRNKR